MDTQEKCYTQLKGPSSSDPLPPPLQASVDEIVKKEGFITYKLCNRSVSSGGRNFMAKLYELDIKGKTVEGDQEINIFIKNKVKDSQLKAIVDVEKSYGIENFFYRELSKLYDDIQNKANIPVEERYAIVKSYDTAYPDAIILENVTKKGYTTIHRMEVAPLNFARLAVQQLAKFHGLSWALEKQHPEFFSMKIKELKTKFKFGRDYQRLIDNMGTYTDKCVDEGMRLKLEKFRPRMLQTLKKYYFENSGTRCCLCHGDYWTSNILVKKDGDTITKIIPVDYQLMYYGCPVMDFIFFIFTCSDQEFRRKHLDDLKNLYHDSLAKFFEKIDMDVEAVYPREEFEAEYKKRLNFGLIMTQILSPVLFTDDDDIPDVNKEDLGTVIVTPTSKMDERIRGIVDDFQNWGYILSLFVVNAVTLEPTVTIDFPVEYWKYDPENHREVIYKRIAKGLAETEAKLGRPLRSMRNESLEKFLDKYLAEAHVDYNSKTPDNWTFINILENLDKTFFGNNVFRDFRNKFETDENVKKNDKDTQNKREFEEETESSEPLGGWTFKDFIEKYRPMVVLQQIKEKGLVEGRNVTNSKKISLLNNIDPTDELLGLKLPRSGRRWWNDQWQLPQGPEQDNQKIVKTDDIANSLLFMRQTIYQARDKMIIMQHMRQQFKQQAVFKMGYLFAKTDYACKIFSSLAFKSYRACSMIRQRIFGSYRLYHHFIDVAHSIERLLARWFDVDILKDLLVTNNIIATVILKDSNLTSAAMVVDSFNKMFIN